MATRKLLNQANFELRTIERKLEEIGKIHDPDWATIKMDLAVIRAEIKVIGRIVREAVFEQQELL